MIQSFPLANSVTKIDGGNIVTGSILGTSLKAGDVTADRLNAGSIQASTIFIPAVVNGINAGVGGTWIDGGAIKTGTVDTNRLNVTGVIQAINSEGSTTIAGNKIRTGEITTEHLGADLVTAGLIRASKLEVNGIINLINGGSQTKLTGAGIATGAIDATKLVLKPGGMGTINIDPMLQDPSIWGWEGTPGTFATVSDAPVGTTVIRSSVGGGGGYPQDKTNYPIDRFKKYRVRFWARSVGSPGMLYFCLRQYKADGVTVCNYNGGRSPYQPDAVIVPTTWTEYSHEWNSSHWQPDMKFVRMDWLLNYNGGATYMEICYPRFEEMVNAELIVDGAVTANTIRTGEFYSQGSGGSYQPYNYSNNTATGFKLAHTPFTATNKWGRTQSIQAEFGSTVLVKGYPLGPALAVPLSALDFPPLDQLDATSGVFYRGNIQDSTRTAPLTPNIDCVTLQDFGGIQWDQADQWRFRMTIQPTAFTDNLDAMRMARVKVFLASGGTAIDTLYVPLYDRFYANFTHSDPSNAIVVDFNWFKRAAGGALGSLWSSNSPYYFAGHLLVAISNAYGWSDERWFHAQGNGTYIRDTTAPSGAPPAGGGSGSPGAGRGCVPAGTLLSTAGMGLIPVERVIPGLQVEAYDEYTLEPCSAKVVRLFTYHNRDMYRVVTDRGAMVCSHDHRFTRMTGMTEADFPPSRELEPNDIVMVQGQRGPEAAIVSQVTPLGYQDTVYHVQLDKGHVFVVGGFLSHNMLDKFLLD